MENGIVTLARRRSLCKITSGAITALPKIVSIAVGDGGTDQQGQPIAPRETQESLTHKLGVFPAAVSYPSEIVAEYVAVIPKNALEGETINEIGLIDEQGTLCTIQTVLNKRKDGDSTMTITVRDEF